MPVRGADAIMAPDGRTVQTPAVEEDLAAGINAVMEKLKQSLHPEPLVSRGEALSALFKGSRYHRRHGQRMTELIAIFEEGLERLRQEGVDVVPLEPTLGWFFIQHAALTPERRERVLTAIGKADYTLAEAKAVCLRLFAEIHMHESGGRRPPPSPYRRPAQVAQVSAGTEDDEEAEEEEEGSEESI